jgi:hypothetical protein
MTEIRARGEQNSIAEAEKVRDELNAALRSAGLVLPSLSVDRSAYYSTYPAPLIELGRCNLKTARKLMAVLERTATR